MNTFDNQTSTVRARWHAQVLLEAALLKMKDCTNDDNKKLMKFVKDSIDALDTERETGVSTRVTALDALVKEEEAFSANIQKQILDEFKNAIKLVGKTSNKDAVFMTNNKEMVKIGLSQKNLKSDISKWWEMKQIYADGELVVEVQKEIDPDYVCRRNTNYEMIKLLTEAYLINGRKIRVPYVENPVRNNKLITSPLIFVPSAVDSIRDKYTVTQAFLQINLADLDKEFSSAGMQLPVIWEASINSKIEQIIEDQEESVMDRLVIEWEEMRQIDHQGTKCFRIQEETTAKMTRASKIWIEKAKFKGASTMGTQETRDIELVELTLKKSVPVVRRDIDKLKSFNKRVKLIKSKELSIGSWLIAYKWKKKDSPDTQEQLESRGDPDSETYTQGGSAKKQIKTSEVQSGLETIDERRIDEEVIGQSDTEESANKMLTENLENVQIHDEEEMIMLITTLDKDKEKEQREKEEKKRRKMEKKATKANLKENPQGN